MGTSDYTTLFRSKPTQTQGIGDCLRYCPGGNCKYSLVGRFGGNLGGNIGGNLGGNYGGHLGGIIRGNLGGNL